MMLVRPAIKMKKLAILLACSPLLLLSTERANAQAAPPVSASPTDLSFGIPTGTTPAVSAAQQITLTLSGQAPITFTGANSGASAVPVSVPTDFIVNGNSCTGTITPPNTCQISVYFSDSVAPQSTLETATLTISYTINAVPGAVTVPMNGAYGAIELFGAININPSVFPGLTWPQSAGNPVKTASINLSCPTTGPLQALLSSTPDGLSNVFQDNTIQITDTIQKPSTVVTTTNVCYGGDPNFEGFTGFPAGTTNCFQTSYESAAASYFGQNPDLATAGDGGPGSFVATYGVQPIDLQSAGAGEILFYNPVVQPGSQTLTVQLTDAGGDLGAATLHLVTNCTQTGITPGGTITGNPITGGNVASQTQTFVFDNSPGQNISFTTSEAVAIQQGTVGAPNGTVPQVSDFGIPQEMFHQLVTGTSAAPAVCLRMTGERDPVTQQKLCKAFMLVCVNPATGQASGDNCVSGNDTARNLYDSAQFDSPDAPVPMGPSPQNYLSPNASVNACGNLGAGITCAPGTGPGLLLGSDNWLTLTNDQYSSQNCSFIGTLSGDLCPLDTLTQFRGAADPLPGGRTSGRNTIYVAVVNKPLPSTNASIAGQANGWVTSPNVAANFTSKAATYTPGPNNPPCPPVTCNFVTAAPYSLTYGISSASVPVPDPTYAVPGDLSNPNAFTAANFAAPLCNAGGITPSSFSSNALFGGLADGLYNLHYFTTDCALTEELRFNPSQAQLTDPAANWASFPTLLFGVDSIAPTITASFSEASPFLINDKVQATYTCKDPASASGFASGIANCAGRVPAPCAYATPNANFFSFVANVDTSPAAFGPHVVTTKDCAGNTGNTVAYTVAAPSADVAVFEGRSSDYISPGGTLTYVVWAVDLSQSTAYGVKVNASVPSQYLQARGLTGFAQPVACKLTAGANGSVSVTCADITSGAPCTPGALGTISCGIGTLPSIYALKGVKIKIMVPVLANVPVGTNFVINANVMSDNDQNTRNNNTFDTLHVVSSNPE